MCLAQMTITSQLPVRYLGLPLMTKAMTAHDYLPLIEKIRKRISSWTGRFLSYCGRLQLIKSVLMSITNFWSSAFRLPGNCMKEIERLCSAFLWSGPDLKTHNAKIAWSKVCLPMCEGGLGLRPLKEINTVCGLKLIWRLLASQTSLWGQWVQTYLIRRNNFWAIKASSYQGSWMCMVPQATPKFAFITWLGMHNRLSTGDRMQKWNGQADSTCVFCQDPLETRDHLFFHCHYANQIWEIIAKGFMGVQYTSNWDQLASLIAGTSLEPFLCFFCSMLFKPPFTQSRESETIVGMEKIQEQSTNWRKPSTKQYETESPFSATREIKNMRTSSVFGSPLEANLSLTENFLFLFLKCCT
ncbi:Hypothetical protein [Arabidopsis thaliana]|uniref:T10P12.5 protein n=1 Tax=Arabidopsis thaliana TaxID=3702 RepID=Q9XIG3_ARATH|nr:Hypothetical protein [Arabidopsis thaliana]